MALVALSTKAVGSVVKIKESGTAQNYIVVHHGKPSSIYDNSFTGGTILLRQNSHSSRVWNTSSNNAYATSAIHTWLNGIFLNTIDANISSKIVQVKIPYRAGTGTSATVTSGTSGLSCKVFLASGRELGIGISDGNGQYLPSDGAKWDYFLSGVGSSALSLRNLSTSWWLRSPSTYYEYTSSVGEIISGGGCYSNSDASLSKAIRPALVLPSSILVDDSGNVTTNTAPPVPGSITVPTTVNGGTTITVSWASVTDAENNLAGYKVERSLSGGTWTQIYQGTATSTTNAVAFGSTTVAYRVKAYDTEGLESTYQTSATRTVVNNVAPTTPGSINVPTTVIGGDALIITWTASTDSDGNLSGYILQRSTDGGTTYTQVFKGSALSYTDTITKGWASVRYRVQAYDASNATSSYVTSPARTVDNTVAPQITSVTSGDMGLTSEGFGWTYTVTQADSEVTTVTEKIDGVNLRSYTATLGQQETFSVVDMTFMTLLNGNHTMTVTATALNGKSTTYTVTFSKGVYALSITLAEPMEADALIAKMVQNIQRSIPADATFTVHVTNNAKDADPVWEDATTSITGGHNYIFTNQTAANGSAFNFRITASRGASGDGGFIASIGGAFE